MKNKLFSLMPLLFIMLAFVPKPKVHFEKKEIDLGKIDKKEVYKETFIFENTGTTPLIIDNIKTSCGCTTVTYSKEPIQPGAIGKIAVGYKPKKTDQGFISKSFTIDFNNGEFRDFVFLKGIIE